MVAIIPTFISVSASIPSLFDAVRTAFPVSVPVTDLPSIVIIESSEVVKVNSSVISLAHSSVYIPITLGQMLSPSFIV